MRKKQKVRGWEGKGDEEAWDRKGRSSYSDCQTLAPIKRIQRCKGVRDVEVSFPI